MVCHECVEELLRLRMSAALLQVWGEVRRELLRLFYPSLNFHIAGAVTLGLLASRILQDTQPHIRISTLSPTVFDTDVERSIILSLSISHLHALRSLTIKGSKAEGMLIEYKGKGSCGDRNVRNRSANDLLCSRRKIQRVRRPW